MRRKATMALWLTCCAALLSACASDPQVKIKRVQPKIPTELRTPPPVPEPPAGEYTQADVARYLLDLTERLEACRDTHRTLVDLIDPKETDHDQSTQ